MTTFEELITSLPEDQQSLINGMIEKEKQKGIDSYRKKDQEVLKLKSNLKELGYNKDEYENVDQFSQNIKAKLEKQRDSEITLASLSERINEMTMEKEAQEKETNNLYITSKLKDAIGKKLYGSEAIIENVVLKNELVVDGKDVKTNAGEVFDTFIENLLEVHKDDVRPETQTPGVAAKLKSTKIPASEDAFMAQFKTKN